MAQIIKPKRSHTASSVPTTSDLEPNEIALNTADKKLYVRDESNNIVSIGGGVTNPMSADLDTASFEIKNTSDGATAGEVERVTFASMPCLPKMTLAQAQALTRIDPQYARVGGEYKIYSVGNTNWTNMGATSGTAGEIFTVTAAAPSGTTGILMLGRDSTPTTNELSGLMCFATDLSQIIFYNAAAYGWNSVN